MKPRALPKPSTSLNSATSRFNNLFNQLLTIREASQSTAPASSLSQSTQDRQHPLSSSSSFMDTTNNKIQIHQNLLDLRGATNNTKRANKKKSSLLFQITMVTRLRTNTFTMVDKTLDSLSMEGHHLLMGKCQQRWRAMINFTCNSSTIRTQEI